MKAKPRIALTLFLTVMSCQAAEKASASETLPIKETMTGMEMNSTNIKSVLSSPDNWQSHSKQKIIETLLSSIIYYGTSGDDEVVSDLSKYYNFAVTKLEPSTRDGILERIALGIENGDLSIKGLSPFIFLEREPSIVGAAVLDFVALNGSGPTLAAQTAISWFKNNEVNSRAGVIAGLIAYGDREVNSLLFPLRNDISVPDLQQVVESFPQFANIEAFDWWLSCMEERPADKDDERFGLMATALTYLVKQSLTPFFQTGGRSLQKSGESKEVLRDSTKVYFPEDVGWIYANRLYPLEEREAPPKTMSHVLSVYGLEPHAPISEQFRPTQEMRSQSDNWIWLRFVYEPSERTLADQNQAGGNLAPGIEQDLAVIKEEQKTLALQIAKLLGASPSSVFAMSRLSMLDGDWKPTILIRIDPDDDGKLPKPGEVRSILDRVKSAKSIGTNLDWSDVLVYGR